MEMLELAIEEYKDRVMIDPILLEDRISSTTLAQAEYLRARYDREIPQVF